MESMVKMAEITTGKNLKRIRKELGLKQHEIVGDDITRNLISMIENDKSPLNYTVAKVIADNMNRISKERDIGAYVDAEDIMNPERMEAKRSANKIIAELKGRIENKNFDLDEEYIKNIEEFLNEWGIPDKKVEVYKLIADICYCKNDLTGEYLYLNKALENYYITPVKKDIYIVVANLIANCVNTERYTEGLRFSELDFVNDDNVPDEYKANVCYNRALAYKRQKDYHKSLEIISDFEKLFSNDEKLLNKVLITKGACYHYIGKTDKAVEVYKEIINNYGEENDEVGLAYANILDILIEEDKKEEVIAYRDKLKNIIKDINKNNEYLVKIYHGLAEACEYLGDTKLAEYYYIIAFDKSVEQNDFSERSKVLHRLIKLYGKTDQMNKIVAIDNVLKKYFDDIPVTEDIKLVLELISINIKNDKEDQVYNIIQYLTK